MNKPINNTGDILSPKEVRGKIIALAKEADQITSRKNLYEIFQKKYGKLTISQATFYRRFNELIKAGEVQEVRRGEFKVTKEENLFTLYDLMEKCTINKRIYYHVTKPEYGQIIAQIINEHYIDYKKYFHCSFYSDLLICYYYDKKGAKYSLTGNEIRNDIEQLLKKHSIYYKE